MSNLRATAAIPDQAERERALDPQRSILVRAPAGSGKTTLLAERFLCLLAEVEDPGQIVAITFTKAAAAEMRNRVLDALGAAEPNALARRALERSRQLGWNLLDLPAQLRIQTIDSFCRDLALQQPLLSGLGGGLEISENTTELYRRAARRTLGAIGSADAALSAAVERLLLWRDNSWNDLESQLVDMLSDRDRWMHDFLLTRAPDWPGLRTRLEGPLAAAGDPDLTGYTDAEWEIVRACFQLLRHAAGQLRVVFAEAGVADFTEVAQIAQSVLKGADGFPIDAAFAVTERIRHLLVDEFQDTSRRQHQLLANLIAAWSGEGGRTCFVVGDPMQSIYFFRDADAELFPRVEQFGLEIPGEEPFRFDPVHLTANFRTAPALVACTNSMFAQVFAQDDGSGILFTAAEPARESAVPLGPRLVGKDSDPFQLHLEFIPEKLKSNARGFTPERKAEIDTLRAEGEQTQLDEIVALIAGQVPQMEAARAAGKKHRVAVLGRTRKILAPIAAALRNAGIPFRAVDLEELKQRPEILDALALVRALLNPQDRVGWLGLLRAPWCGLSLADLHTLTSADEASFLTRTVRELLSERMHLLSADGRHAVARVMRAVEFAEQLRFAQPVATTGTWLEQVWLQLGGARCVDATARANLDLLWGCLDQLPEGEPGLLGPALDAALNKLKAQPDPQSDSDCAVQLMTIHKSKGLEFEIVIVPDLHAAAGGPNRSMLSWLERGLAEPGESGEVTEFLVAPIAAKGSKGGSAKKWVDNTRRDRERQEMRRLLYVAATRAREELHFFARPSYKMAQDCPPTLVEPAISLLKTAWPALGEEIRSRFEARLAEPTEIAYLAAGDEEQLAKGSGRAGTVLRRLPAEFAIATADPLPAALESPAIGVGQLYQRHEGGLVSRALGRGVHLLLQELANLLATQSMEAALAALPAFATGITAHIRSAGIEAGQANRIAAQAIEIAHMAATDPIGNWILGPHADAASEIRWTGVVEGRLRTVQVDRVFRAGAAPLSPTEHRDTWWIVDYKTSHEDGLNPTSALPELRQIFAAQLEAYATMLRNLHGADAPVCAGLYYPRMALFDWWKL